MEHTENRHTRSWWSIFEPGLFQDGGITVSHRSKTRYYYIFLLLRLKKKKILSLPF